MLIRTAPDPVVHRCPILESSAGVQLESAEWARPLAALPEGKSDAPSLDQVELKITREGQWLDYNASLRGGDVCKAPKCGAAIKHGQFRCSVCSCRVHKLYMDLV